MILRPPPRVGAPCRRAANRLAGRLARLPHARHRHRLVDHALLPSLYHLLPQGDIAAVLRLTGTASARLRRLPAHEVAWLVVAMSLFRDRGVPMVWRHIHPGSDSPLPTDTAFTLARQRLGFLPMKLLFHRTCRPLEESPAAVRCGRWLVVALDGTVIEAPDTPANRRAFGSASNQHGEGAFPQLRLSAICEAGTHAVTDVEMGPYVRSEQELSLKVLRRLPAGRLVLMDRGLSYYELVAAVLRRRSHVLARVKVSRALPVEKRLADGSYLSTIYPSSNDRRGKRGGIRVRVVRYARADAGGEETVLITTVLKAEELSAQEAVWLYPWRWEEESTLKEMKGVMLQGNQPLLRSKKPGLVVQEVYGLLIGHYLVRREMAKAAAQAGVEALQLSFKRSLEVLEDRMREQTSGDWLAGLRGEIGRQRLRPRRERHYPRVRKATRNPWPNKKPRSKSPPQPAKPFHEKVRIVQT